MYYDAGTEYSGGDEDEESGEEDCPNPTFDTVHNSGNPLTPPENVTHIPVTSATPELPIELEIKTPPAQ